MSEKSKVYFHKTGTQFRVTPKVHLDLHETLPVGTYNINYDDCAGVYYLEIIEDFHLSGKMYGNVSKRSKRIIQTFLDRHRSTGVLLVGEKGSGKTLLAQHTSILAAKEHGIPTIVVNKPWFGDNFNSFIQSISQPVIIFFDEFEKVYDMHSGENYQEKILTLFDGVYASQKLFLLTCNDKNRLDEHMMNRPGRLYYMIEFHGLDQDFIMEYCEHNLVQKHYVAAVAASAGLFQSFNFDMLKALVEDMNRYGESPAEVLKWLNISTNDGGYERFKVKLIVAGKKVDKVQKAWCGTPTSQVIKITSSREGEDGEEVEKRHFFSAVNLQRLDPKIRRFEFKNEAGEMLTLTPFPEVKIPLIYDTLTSLSFKKSPSAEAICEDILTEEETYAEMESDY